MPTQYIIYPNPTITATATIAGNVTVVQPSGANLHVDVDNFPATQPVSGTVKIEDTAGNALTSTASALNVNIAGSTGSSNVNINGLINFQTSQYTVGTSAVQLTVTPLTNRSSMSIKATTTTNTDVVYIGNSSGVTTSTGYALFLGDSLQLDLTPAHQVWAIATSASQKLYVAEIGD